MGAGMIDSIKKLSKVNTKEWSYSVLGEDNKNYLVDQLGLDKNTVVYCGTSTKSVRFYFAKINGRIFFVMFDYAG